MEYEGAQSQRGAGDGGKVGGFDCGSGHWARLRGGALMLGLEQAAHVIRLGAGLRENRRKQRAFAFAGATRGLLAHRAKARRAHAAAGALETVRDRAGGFEIVRAYRSGDFFEPSREI